MARAHPEVAYTYTTVGSASGSGSVDNGTMYVRLEPQGASATSSQEELGQALRRELAHRRRDRVSCCSRRLGGGSSRCRCS